MKDINKKYDSIVEMPPKERIPFILQALREDPYYTEEQGSFELMAEKGNEVIEGFFHLDKSHPFITKFGDRLYFEPDKDLIERDGYLKAQAKHAVHFVTQSPQNPNEKRRYYHAKKANSIQFLKSLIENPDDKKLQLADIEKKRKEATIYIKEVCIRNFLCAVLQAEIDKKGNLVMITILPNKKKLPDYWLDIPKVSFTEQSSTGETASGTSDDPYSADTQNKDTKENDSTKQNFEQGGQLPVFAGIYGKNGKIYGILRISADNADYIPLKKEFVPVYFITKELTQSEANSLIKSNPIMENGGTITKVKIQEPAHDPVYATLQKDLGNKVVTNKGVFDKKYVLKEFYEVPRHAFMKEGGYLYSSFKKPLEYIKAKGYTPTSDLNYVTEKNAIEYFVGRKGNKAIVVAFITDEDNYIITKEDAREMAETAREAGVDHVELHTNYGIELHSKLENPRTIGFDKIAKITHDFREGGQTKSKGEIIILDAPAHGSTGEKISEYPYRFIIEKDEPVLDSIFKVQSYHHNQWNTTPGQWYLGTLLGAKKYYGRKNKSDYIPIDSGQQWGVTGLLQALEEAKQKLNINTDTMEQGGEYKRGGNIWKSLDFENIEQYYDYVHESLINGNFSQVRSLYDKMDYDQKRHFFSYARQNGYDETIKWINEKMEEGGSMASGGKIDNGYTFTIQNVKDYNRSASPIMKFYHEGGEKDGELRERGYVLIWKHTEGGSGAKFYRTMEEAESAINKMKNQKETGGEMKEGGEIITKEEYKKAREQYDYLGAHYEDAREETNDKKTKDLKEKMDDLERKMHRYERKDEYAAGGKSGKHYLKEAIIEWQEGPNHRIVENKSYDNWDELEAQVLAVYEEERGYNKTKIKFVWDNGSYKQLRIDVGPNDWKGGSLKEYFSSNEGMNYGSTRKQEDVDAGLYAWDFEKESKKELGGLLIAGLLGAGVGAGLGYKYRDSITKSKEEALTRKQKAQEAAKARIEDQKQKFKDRKEKVKQGLIGRIEKLEAGGQASSHKQKLQSEIKTLEEALKNSFLNEKIKEKAQANIEKKKKQISEIEKEENKKAILEKEKKHRTQSLKSKSIYLDVDKNLKSQMRNALRAENIPYKSNTFGDKFRIFLSNQYQLELATKLYNEKRAKHNMEPVEKEQVSSVIKQRIGKLKFMPIKERPKTKDRLKIDKKRVIKPTVKSRTSLKDKLKEE